MWKWNERARRYYDDETGQFMARDTVLTYVQRSIDAADNVSDTLASLLTEQRLSLDDWSLLMREEIKREYIRQYLLGMGGVAQMMQEDWGSIGGMLADQYRYLDRFAGEIAAGNLSPAQIVARARMYIRSAREGQERANGRAWGDPPLPAYPGDGSTSCRTNCACYWDIRSAEVGDDGRMKWSCWWTMTDAEHCDDCAMRAQLWAPLIVSTTA